MAFFSQTVQLLNSLHIALNLHYTSRTLALWCIHFCGRETNLLSFYYFLGAYTFVAEKQTSYDSIIFFHFHFNSPQISLMRS